MFKEKEVKTYIVRFYCDECGEEMTTTGLVLTSYPIKIEYICPKCNRKEYQPDHYPKTIYKEIEM